MLLSRLAHIVFASFGDPSKPTISRPKNESAAPAFARTRQRWLGVSSFTTACGPYGSIVPAIVVALGFGPFICRGALAQDGKDSRSPRMTIAGAHSSYVQALQFSPDGSLLASGDFDGSLKLWDVASRRLRLKLSGTSDWVTSLAFSPGGKTLAATGTEKLGTNRYAGVALLWEPYPRALTDRRKTYRQVAMRNNIQPGNA